MNPTSSELTFQPTTIAIIFAVVAIVLTIGLSLVTWRRNHFSKGVGWLEFLRNLIIIAIAITVFQPEWREIFEPEEKPVLAVLRDVSNSMTTEDVIDPDNPAASAKSRNQIAESLVDPEEWGSISDKMNVIFRTFSSGETPADSASDLNQALENILEQNPNLRGVVLISDGDWNIGNSPSRASVRLRMREIPVFALSLIHI